MKTAIKYNFFKIKRYIICRFKYLNGEYKILYIKNNAHIIKQLLYLLVAIFFVACDSHECRTKFNDNANKIIFQRIRNFEHLGGAWTCCVDARRDCSMIYGASDSDMKILLEDLSKAIHLPNINLEFYVYEYTNPKDKNLKPKAGPIMVIKIDKTKGE
ncbi:hypothetical protein F1B92_04710 [Campylobacter sp. FMV-PI01]|uniref:Uncharacterized protein n=1 Tax=Campylobacter portucalensis TaxID=2608384 RepID=A0A6L5WJQ4_9BACT|nr:hypothetical protein [Campylobacter portucalensis]MSN96477.1 hypothetical protein [Campylobacter portucalensis]